jgi:ATP-dependent DNA helicase RecQ
MKEMEDATELARKLFLSIIDLRENYGSLYYIDFLKGSNAAHVRADHKLLPSYGIGVDAAKSKWKKLILEMLEQGYLIKTKGMFPLIKLTAKCHKFLETPETILVSKAHELENEKALGFEYEHQLYVQLRQLQMKIAREESLATYLVLPGNTLFLLAALLPHTKDELRAIKGFGDLRIAKYGQQFLDVIIGYCKTNELSGRVPPHVAPLTQHLSETRERTFKLFTDGKNVVEIAEQRKLMPSTIESHLAFYVRTGMLQLEQLMDSRKIAPIRDTVQRVGKESLLTVRENLGENYSYAEIRYVIAQMDFESKEVWTQSYYEIELDVPLLACD